MAAKGVLAEKPVEEMVTMKLEHSSKSDITQLNCPKDGAMSDATSCISSVDAVCSTKEIESDQEALVVDQSVYYPVNNFYGYYYPGSEMQFAQWNEQGYMLGTDGLEMQQPVMQSDNGSLVYYVPGFQPAYSFLPEPMVGIDGQCVGQLPYVMSPGTPQSLGSPLYYPPLMGYGPEVLSAYGWDTSLWGYNAGNGYMGNLTMPATQPKYSAKSQYGKPTANLKSAPLENKGSTLELPPRVKIPTLPVKPARESFVPSKGYSPVDKLPSYICQGKGGPLYPNISSSIKENGRSWVSTEKFKVRNKLSGFDDVYLLNEQNRGPRTINPKNTSTSGADHAGAPVAELEDDCCGKTLVIRRGDYNLHDFSTKYEHAMFFIIKSYSEDDIHKSIKYNVWASTPNGNKRLDNAFLMAREKMGEKGCKCPIFLFFSVNASGQFCGVAEMIGRVDFDQKMDFWQQDKWNGFFPVKWHIIKDVPNPQFRHIILENNDHKPVTNSRDTQEVKFPQGSEMLNIFKSFSNKTSILDDYGFYENRQKVMQDKRTKTLQTKIEETAKVNKTDDLKAIVSSMEVLKLNVSQVPTTE